MKTHQIASGDIRGRNLSTRAAKEIQTYIQTHMGGRATPEELVQRARPQQSPLHKYFEWNEKKAHEMFLRWQARELLASIEVFAANGWVRHYVNVKIAGAPSYVDIRTAMASQDLSKQVIAYAMREAVEWKRRYETYRELRPIHLAVGRVQRKLERKIA